MKTYNSTIFLLSVFIVLVGCSENTNQVEENPHAFLNIETSEENERIVPLYYIVDPVTENVSVLESMDDDFEYYTLENFEVTEEIISFTYNRNGIELLLVSEGIYEDSYGNIYQMRTVTEEAF